jgi:hypothetical protein
MNSTPESQSVAQRSPVVRACKWLCSWPGIRRVLIVFAWVATVIVLFYAEENWRGRRAWDNYRRQLPQGGAELVFASHFPKPVPEEQNLAGTPFIKGWMVPQGPEEGTNRWPDLHGKASGLVPDIRKKKEPAHRTFLDLVAWKGAFARAKAGTDSEKVGPGATDIAARSAAAPAILEALRLDEAIFAELKAAAKRPFALYPVNYNVEIPAGILLPHLANIRGTTRRLQLKACAELALGQTEPALEDIELILRLADPLKHESMLVSQLVRVASFQAATQPIWEGLVEHRWSAPQLERLRQALAGFGFLGEMQFSFNGERACGVATVDFIRARGRLTNLAGPDSIPCSGVVDFVARFMPGGWYRMEQVNLCKATDIALKGAIDVNARRVWPARLQANSREAAQWLGNPGRGALGKFWRHQIVASMMMFSVDKAAQKISASQVAADQAVIACALEEYRLAKGAYPDALNQLDPKTVSRLPNDVLTGEPYQYKRTGEGYVLYSVGWNEKDDGGQPGETLTGSNQGDWVWALPSLKG